jgi:glycosyltransferase involved in cell wall biosynthesis
MIDVMIITFNESLNLPHCLEALQGWTRKIFVLDSGSTDGTQDIARSFGAEVVHHDWPGYARQKNWGLDNLPLEAPWILLVDADEIITEPVKNRLIEIASRDPDSVPENGFFINRLTYFMDRPIRHCGYYPSWNMRFFKRGLAKYEDRAVHEHMIIDEPVGYIHEAMDHNDRRGLEHFVAKHNRYSTLEARTLFEELQRDRDGKSDAEAEANLALQTRWRRWLKKNVIPRVPCPGAWRFMYMYVVKLGVLDGRAGLDFCRFIGSYDALVALKLRALKQYAREHPEMMATLSTDKAAVGLAQSEGEHPVVLEAQRESEMMAEAAARRES